MDALALSMVNEELGPSPMNRDAELDIPLPLDFSEPPALESNHSFATVNVSMPAFHKRILEE